MRAVNRLLVFLFLLSSTAFADEKKAQLCTLCHRASGMGAPLLEAQTEAYLVSATTDYKAGRRKSPSMDPNVAKLTPRDIAGIARYFAAQPQPAHGQPIDAAKGVAGEAKTKDLGCTGCHGADLKGAGAVPRLAGQTPVYLAMELDSFNAGRRRHPAKDLPTGPDVDSVSHYLGSLK